MKLAQRITRIKPSATLTINTKAQELRAAGRQIVSLAVGEPDFRTPEHVCDAAKTAMDEGFTRYTPVPGIPELRTAVAGYFKTFYGVDAAMENVVVTNGGKQSLYNLFQVLLDPGDEVIIPAPYWVSYPALVQLADGVPVFVTTEPQHNFLVSVEQLEAVRTPRTRCLVMNTPSNPTGCHYTQEQLDAMDKGINLQMVAQTLTTLEQAGIATYVYLLFGTPSEGLPQARKTLDFVVTHENAITFLNLAVFNMPVCSPEAQDLHTQDFYEGDLSLYSDFVHPQGWGRKEIRTFLDKEFKRHPAVIPILQRDPPTFTSNHAPFFSRLNTK